MSIVKSDLMIYVLFTEYYQIKKWLTENFLMPILLQLYKTHIIQNHVNWRIGQTQGVFVRQRNCVRTKSYAFHESYWSIFFALLQLPPFSSPFKQKKIIREKKKRRKHFSFYHQHKQQNACDYETLLQRRDREKITNCCFSF